MTESVQKDVAINMPEQVDSKPQQTCQQLRSRILQKVFLLYLAQIATFLVAMCAALFWRPMYLVIDSIKNIWKLNALAGAVFVVTDNILLTFRSYHRKPVWTCTFLFIHTIALSLVFTLVLFIFKSPFLIPILIFSWTAIAVVCLTVGIAHCWSSFDLTTSSMIFFTMLAMAVSTILCLLTHCYVEAIFASLCTGPLMWYLLFNTRQTISGPKYNLQTDSAPYLALRVNLDVVKVANFFTEMVKGPRRKEPFKAT